MSRDPCDVVLDLLLFIGVGFYRFVLGFFNPKPYPCRSVTDASTGEFSYTLLKYFFWVLELFELNGGKSALLCYFWNIKTPFLDS